MNDLDAETVGVIVKGQWPGQNYNQMKQDWEAKVAALEEAEKKEKCIVQ